MHVKDSGRGDWCHVRCKSGSLSIIVVSLTFVGMGRRSDLKLSSPVVSKENTWSSIIQSSELTNNSKCQDNMSLHAQKWSDISGFWSDIS